jgi:3-dehydroquinate synthase
MIDDELLARHGDILRSFTLPTAAPGLDVQRVLDAMLMDKKVVQGKLQFVLLEGIGRPVVQGDVPEDLVRRVLRELAAG